MLRGFILGVVATLVIAALGGYVFISAGLFPANADAKPGGLERWAAHTSLDATVARETVGLVAPIQPTDENLLAGVKVYEGNCAVCHGAASGPGTNIARGFYQHAPQFQRGGPSNDPVAETYWKATHGIRLTAMPHFSKTLTDTQRWQVALLLKNIKQLSPKVEAAWRKVKISEALAPPMPDRPQGAPGPGGP